MKKQLVEVKEQVKEQVQTVPESSDTGVPVGEMVQSKSQEDLVKEIEKRKGSLEQDHLRLKELEVTVLYEELNTRNLLAIKNRMQSFITIKEIELKYNRLVEADRLFNDKANKAQEQLMKIMSEQNTIELENLVSSDN